MIIHSPKYRIITHIETTGLVWIYIFIFGTHMRRLMAVHTNDTKGDGICIYIYIYMYRIFPSKVSEVLVCRDRIKMTTYSPAQETAWKMSFLFKAVKLGSPLSFSKFTVYLSLN